MYRSAKRLGLALSAMTKLAAMPGLDSVGDIELGASVGDGEVLRTPRLVIIMSIELSKGPVPWR